MPGHYEQLISQVGMKVKNNANNLLTLLGWGALTKTLHYLSRVWKKKKKKKTEGELHTEWSLSQPFCPVFNTWVSQRMVCMRHRV